MRQRNDALLVGLVLLGMILGYGYLAYKAAKVTSETNKIIEHNFKTINDILNGNP